MAFNPISIVGDVGKFHKDAQAQSALKKAGRQQRTAQLLRNLQRRRAFVRTARAAVAQNLVAASAQAGGLDSSAFRGTQASIQTQENIGLVEFDESQLRAQKSQAFVEDAQRKQFQGQVIKQATEFVSNIGGAFS